MRAYFAFMRGQWPLLLFGFACVFFGNFGQSFFLGWYGDAIKTDLGLSAKTYGITYSLATLASAATLLWAGGLIDRMPLARFAFGVSVGLMLACLIMTQAANPWLLAVGFFGLRLFGQGLCPHTGITTMARLGGVDRGKAISIAASGVPVGEIVLPLLVVALLAALPWRLNWYWLAAAVPLLFWPLLALSLRYFPADPVSATAGANRAAGRSAVYGDRRFWLALPSLMCAPFMITGFFIHQDFVLAGSGWSMALLAKCFVLYGVVHWVGSIAFGVLVDRYSGRAMLKLYILPLLAGVIVLANLHGAWTAPLVMFLFGITLGASGPVVGALWAEVYGTEVLGGVRAAVSALMVFASAASPYLFGYLIDAGVSLGGLYNGFGALFLLLWLGLWRSY